MAYIKNAETYSTGPTLKWTITYSASRSGANVNYSISVSTWMADNSGWYNDILAVEMNFNGGNQGSTDIKGQTSGNLAGNTYTKNFSYTAYNKTSGTTPITIKMVDRGYGSLYTVIATASANMSVPAAASTISGTVAGSTLSGPTINVTRYSSGFTDNITLSYNGKSISRNSFSSSKLSFSEAERLRIYQAQGAGVTRSWSISGNTYSGGTYIGSFSGSVNISTEALAKITSANNFNVEDNTTFNVSKGGAYKYNAYAKLVSTSGTVIGSLTDQTTDGSKTMDVSTLANTIYETNTTSQSGTVYWTIESFIDNTSIGSTSGTTSTYTFLQSRCGPTLSTFKYAVTDVGTQTLMSINGSYYDYDSGTNLDKFIQTKTTLGFQLLGTTQKEATIDRYYVQVPSQSNLTPSGTSGTVTTTSQPLLSSGTVYGVIRDSRGFEHKQQFTYELNSYYLPTFIYSITRNPMSATDPSQDAHAKLSATITIPSYIATNIQNDNTKYIKLYYKESTLSSWSATPNLITEFTLTNNTLIINNYQLSVNFDQNTQYDIKLQIVHYYGTTDSEPTVLPISAPLLSKRYQKLGINKLPSTPNAVLDVGGNSNIDGNTEVTGYIKSGAPIYSNTKQLQSYFFLDLSGSDYDYDNFYPVTFPKDSGILDCEIRSRTEIITTGQIHLFQTNVLHFQMLSVENDYQGGTPGQTISNLVILQYECPEEEVIGCIARATNNDNVKTVWLRGGIKYDVYSNYTPTVHKTDYSSGNITVTVGTSTSGDTNIGVIVIFEPGVTINRGAYFQNIKLSVDAIYPVGSIYMSVNNTSPSTLFGGTWVQLKDRFLLGAGDTYSNGATGGSAKLQAHTHSIPSLSGSTNNTGGHTHGVGMDWDGGSGSSRGTVHNAGASGAQSTPATSNAGSHSHTVTTSASTTGSKGDGNSENMPPYLVVYMWKRTA